MSTIIQKRMGNLLEVNMAVPQMTQDHMAVPQMTQDLKAKIQVFRRQ